MAGVLAKQGGSDTKKWQDRHCVLNDNFFFYFEGKGTTPMQNFENKY